MTEKKSKFQQNGKFDLLSEIHFHPYTTSLPCNPVLFLYKTF